MSTERDELAKVIFGSNRNNTQIDLQDNRRLKGSQLAWAGYAADAILAAGYRKPQQVTTVEELDALEDPEVILVDYKHNAYQWGIGLDGSEGWQSTRDPNPITSHHLWRFAPLTVLHVGGAE